MSSAWRPKGVADRSSGGADAAAARQGRWPGRLADPRSGGDLGLGFDPLDCVMGDPWTGRDRRRWKPAASGAPMATRWSALRNWPGSWSPEKSLRTRNGHAPAVLDYIATHLRPVVSSCGDAELTGFCAAWTGVLSNPARPARRRAEGRRFCRPGGTSIPSIRAVPTPAAWHLGWKSASRMSSATFRRTAIGRGPWLCRPGAPPTCGLAATISPRRWL